MNILYINNYRGFQKTCVPLTDVNFLLGENSTGKTSFLSLLHLVSQPYFWLDSQFTTEEVSLGNFDEIVDRTVHDFFEMGIFNMHSGIYMKFTEQEGIPFLSEIRNIRAKTNVFIRKNEKDIHYKVSKYPAYPKSESPIVYFEKWLNSTSPLEKVSVLPLKEEVPNWRTLIFNHPELRSIAADIEFHFPKLPKLTWIAPIRVKPKRYYEGYKVNFSAEGEHIPYLLKGIFQKEGDTPAANIKNWIESFGKNSGLFEKIQIKILGDAKNAPFEIHIVLNEKPMKITNVGYGVSQVLPILVEILTKTDLCFAIQQPEVHLHPKAQAMLGELFFHIAQQEQKSFFIETHSDFMVDRYRLMLRKSNKKLKTKVSNGQVLFFERTERGNVIHVLPLDENGDYPENQPATFRDFFVKEELDLLSY